MLVLCCELPGSCITGCHWGEGQRYVATKEKTESCSPSLLQLTLKPLARFQTRLIANSLNLEAAKRCWRWKYSVSLNHSNGVTFSDIIQPKDSFPSNEMGRTSYKAVATKSLSFLSHPLLSLAPPPLPPPCLSHSLPPPLIPLLYSGALWFNRGFRHACYRSHICHTHYITPGKQRCCL